MYAVIDMAYDETVKTGTREECVEYVRTRNAMLPRDRYTWEAVRDYAPMQYRRAV